MSLQIFLTAYIHHHSIWPKAHISEKIYNKEVFKTSASFKRYDPWNFCPLIDW